MIEAVKLVDFPSITSFLAADYLPPSSVLSHGSEVSEEFQPFPWRESPQHKPKGLAGNARHPRPPGSLDPLKNWQPFRLVKSEICDKKSHMGCRHFPEQYEDCHRKLFHHCMEAFHFSPTCMTQIFMCRSMQYIKCYFGKKRKVSCMMDLAVIE